MSKDQILNLVTEVVMNVLQDLPGKSISDDSAPLHDTIPTPSLEATDSYSQSANSTVSDLTVQTMQRQLEVMQTMMKNHR